MGKDVFLSYKSEDYAETIWLKSVLEANGISCWMAPESIPGGSNYADSIDSAIIECSVLLVVISKKTQESIWIPKEIDMALNAKKVVLPYMTEDCELHKSLKFYLSGIHRYEAFNNKTDTVRKLVKEIRSILGHPVREEDILSVAAGESKKHSDRKPKKEKNIKNESNTKTTPAKSGSAIPSFLLKRGLAISFFFTYFFSFPAGIIATVAHFICKAICKNKKLTNRISKVLCIIGSLVGIAIYFYALNNYSACKEALLTSVPGLLTELFFIIFP